MQVAAQPGASTPVLASPLRPNPGTPTSSAAAPSYSTLASCSVSDTAAWRTPGSAASALSTAEEQLLQVMPSTRKRASSGGAATGSTACTDPPKPAASSACTRAARSSTCWLSYSTCGELVGGEERRVGLCEPSAIPTFYTRCGAPPSPLCPGQCMPQTQGRLACALFSNSEQVAWVTPGTVERQLSTASEHATQCRPSTSSVAFISTPSPSRTAISVTTIGPACQAPD